MRIDRLRARNVRNLREVELQPHPGLNLISGPNAAGKTALLEAIHLLARARSFRTPRIEEVVLRDSEGLQVTARIQHGVDGILDTGIERGDGRWTLRYAGEPVRSVSAHARKFPLVLATPDSQQLLLGGPRLRRHWLDWALFHVEPEYLGLWHEYFRALRQHNHLLKRARAGTEMDAWEELMARAGEPLNAARAGFLDELQGSLADLYSVFGRTEIPGIQLEQGWRADMSLKEALRHSRAADTQSGLTASGPHRADVVFSIGTGELAAWYSRGQCKEFIVLLMLAQASVIARRTGEEPLMLVDDFAAEMDRQAQERLLRVLQRRSGQSFLTCAQVSGDWGPGDAIARFHVEHGTVMKC